jgi:hypothetical protein
MEDNIKMDLQEFGYVGMGRIEMAQECVVNALMNLRVP